MRRTLVLIVTFSISAFACDAWAQSAPADGTPAPCIRSTDTRPWLTPNERAAELQRVFAACDVRGARAVPPRRNGTDAFGYARLGYSGLLAGRSYGTPAMGAGYRVELDSGAFDVSFLNIQSHLGGSGYAIGQDAPTRTLSGSVVKLEALRFLNADSTSSLYVGGGFSAGITEISGPHVHEQGNGIQGELTAGMEFLRDTSMRVFVQGDVILPFYRTTADLLSPASAARSSHYAPSIAISVGIGIHPPRRRQAQRPPAFPGAPRYPLPPWIPWQQPTV